MTHDLHATADRLRESVAGIIAEADAHDDLAAAITRFQDVTGKVVEIVLSDADVAPAHNGGESCDTAGHCHNHDPANISAAPNVEIIADSSDATRAEVPAAELDQSSEGEHSASGEAWTEKELARLRGLRVSNHTWKQIGRMLGRTPDACKTRYRREVQNGSI